MKARLVALALAASAAVYSCMPGDAAAKQSGQSIGTSEAGAEPKGLDPRAAFESSGLLGGMSALPESSIVLIEPAGNPEAGVVLSLGGPLSTAAVARRRGFDHEIVLASGARAALPGPALAMAASGERIAVACAEAQAAALGSLICFKAEGEGEGLAQAWEKTGPPVKRLIAVPAGRIAAADESSRLYLVDAATGVEIWGKLLQTPAADIAYAPGFDHCGLPIESPRVRRINGSLGVERRAYRQRGFDLRRKRLRPGPWRERQLVRLFPGRRQGHRSGHRSLRPEFAAGRGRRLGARRPGRRRRRRDRRKERTNREVLDLGRARLLPSCRQGSIVRGRIREERQGPRFRLEGWRYRIEPDRARPSIFGAPLAQSGARGGLLLLLMDGSLELLGKRRAAPEGASALEAAIAPSPETAQAIASALGRFKTGDGLETRRYLRFDLFAQGIPVDTEVAFTAFRYEGPSNEKRSFAASPASIGAVVAIFDETGRELAASIDELASSSRAAAYFEKGKVYWIVAGWTYQAEPDDLQAVPQITVPGGTMPFFGMMMIPSTM